MWSFFWSSVLETVSICNVLFNVLSSQPPSFHCFSLFQCSWHVILLLLISFGTCFHLQHLAQCFISRTVGDIELKFCMCKHEAKIWVHANFQLRILNRSGNSAIQILPWCCQYRYIVPTVPEGICITKATFNLVLPLGLLSLSWINIHISKMNHILLKEHTFVPSNLL